MTLDEFLSISKERILTPAEFIGFVEREPQIYRYLVESTDGPEVVADFLPRITSAVASRRRSTTCPSTCRPARARSPA